MAREAAAIAEKRKLQQISAEKEQRYARRHSSADELDAHSSADELLSNGNKLQRNKRQSTFDKAQYSKNGGKTHPDRCHSSIDRHIETYQPVNGKNHNLGDKQQTNERNQYYTKRQLPGERSQSSAEEHTPSADKHQPSADKHQLVADNNNIPIANEVDQIPSVHLVGMLKDSQVPNLSSLQTIALEVHINSQDILSYRE